MRPSVDSQATPLPAATTAPGREAPPATISWPPAESTSMGVQELPSRERQALATTSVGDDPRLWPMTTSPPWPSSEMPWATNRRPSVAKAPDPDRWFHVEPSVETQTVVVGLAVPAPVVPTMRRSLSRVVKYGPKSSLATGDFVAACQSML